VLAATLYALYVCRRAVVVVIINIRAIPGSAGAYMYRGNEFWRPRGTTLGPPARIAGRAATRGAVNKTTTERGEGGRG